MANELKLKRGWLKQDGEKAQAKLDRWSRAEERIVGSSSKSAKAAAAAVLTQSQDRSTRK